ncbi:MAG: ThuA domain-containing protein [Actinomycetota bacterium]|jgi:type 1 glutamine amidotransferase|nr:ThuA domain-containing protein [Actinomycetota bacterium]
MENDKAQLRALVVRGGWEGHAPVAATELFAPFLKDRGFDVVFSDTLDAYCDEATMREADLIVQCWTMGQLSRPQLEALDQSVKRGTGFAGWHGGIVDSFRDSPGYLQLTGGQFVAHPANFVDYEVEVVPEQAGHEIVRGLGRFSLHTEQYWVLTDPLDDVLATTRFAPCEGAAWSRSFAVPAVWTRAWGKGKVFVCTVGHRVADLEVPEVRTIIERGLLWASRRGSVPWVAAVARGGPLP